ncbi:beta-L-arabinofuranosidase domain-containing protein [Chitinophaga sp. MM2321]|uniref:beta-L-arabinofuranosidase domain-containing protein n=1 Tax=Chitinophaga sp. MM2321 TaxID=3137178 RepID=UPI0032D57037
MKRYNPVSLLLVIGLLLSSYVDAIPHMQPGDWWNNAWKYRQLITIDAATLKEDLHDFPLSVRLQDAVFARTLAKNGGEDVRAVDMNGALLDVEVVLWAINDVRLYVKMPVISAGKGKQGFYLYFGNPRAAAVTANMWASSYVAVLPLAGNVHDISARKQAVAKVGFVVQNGWTAGLIMGNSFPWITFDSNYKGFLEIDAPVGPDLTFVCRYRTNKNREQVLLAGQGFRFATVDSTAWQSVVFSLNSTTGVRTICFGDGDPVTDKVSLSPIQPGRIRIGRDITDDAKTQFDGDIEDVRIMNSAPAAAWIKATALNLSQLNPLVQPGALEGLGQSYAPPPPPQLMQPANGAQSHKSTGVKLEWLPATGAKSYRVLVFKDARGEQLLHTFHTGIHPSFNLTLALADTRDVYWTVAAISDQGETRAKELYHLTFYKNGMTTGKPVAPQLTRARNVHIQLKGYMGARVDSMAQYMIDYPLRNPGLLRMMRERPEKGVPDWAGVFPGQYLSSAQLIWRLTRHPLLKKSIDTYVRDLLKTQGADGYLEPFENMNRSLSLWNHYAMLCGLISYYEDTRYKPALDASRKIADLVISTFGPDGKLLPKTGGGSEAISHAIVMLYRETGDTRYLDFANYIMGEVWNEPGGVAYSRLGRERLPVRDFPVRRWEGVHNIMALSEMYWLTGDTSCKQGYEHLWRTLRRTERHSTGGFSTNEGLLGTPYNHGTIETCCTVAWSLLSTDMLKLTGQSSVADELEWSVFNSALGSIPGNGGCSTYGTQPEGYRSFCELHQGPADGHELSCCSSNAPRAIGDIANWALMQRPGGLVLNYYGPAVMSAQLPSGQRVQLEQRTAYPAKGAILLNVSVSTPETFTLYLRIPGWSKQTKVLVNGKAYDMPQAGHYMPIRRVWKKGDHISLALDFTPRFRIGEEDYAGKVSIYQGPVLFTSDAHYVPGEQKHPGIINLKGLTITPVDKQHETDHPFVLARMTDGDGKQRMVCDFASAGMYGDYYRSWFDAAALPPAPFYQEAPLRQDSGLTLSWEARSGAENWTVLISATPDFKEAVRYEGLKRPQLLLPSPAKGNYYWTVVAYNANGETKAENAGELLAD